MTYKNFNRVMKSAEQGDTEVEYWAVVRQGYAVAQVRSNKTGKSNMVTVNDVPQWFVDQHKGK